jgi:signal transduction histidine kinase
MENQLFIALQNNKLFTDIELENLDLSEIKGELKPLKEGEILFREEDPANHIYLVVSGEINLLKKKLLGSTKSFIFSENDFFGYDEIADSTTRTSTAVALRDCYLIALTEDEVEKLVEHNHMIKTNLLNYSDIQPQFDINEDETESPPEIETDNQPEVPQKSKDKKADVTSFEQSLKDDLIDKHDTTIEEDHSVYEEEIEETFDKVHTDELSDKQVEQNVEETTQMPEEPLFDEDEEELESTDDFSTVDKDVLESLSKEEDEQNKPEEKEKFTDFDEAFYKAFSEQEEPKPHQYEEPEESFNTSETEEPQSLEENEEIKEEEYIEEVKEEFPQEEEPAFEVPTEKEEELKVESKEEFEQPAEPASSFEKKLEKPAAKSAKLQHDELQKIIKASQLVNSNIKIDEVLQNIVKVATDLTKADRGTLYLIDKEKNELWSKIAMGNETKEIRLKIGEGIAGWVAQNRETVNIEDAANDERFKSDFDRTSGYQTKSMLCFPLKNRDDEIVGVIQLLNSKNGKFTEMDEEFLSAISIQCSLALQNAEMLEKLLQSERVQSLGKMTNFLIQDIKKPVLVSKRYVEHLKSKELNKDAAQLVEMVLEQLTQVADLVQTTSSYSEGKAVLRASRTNLNEILSEYSDRLESYVKSRGSEIVNNFDKDAKVNIDSKEFFQCYNHIIRNACDAMPDGGKIEVSTKLGKDEVTISIKDGGLGIPDSLLEKIFEPFMTHGKKEGTGLGLTITKKIVESHSGKIFVESNLGEGATVNISLPLTSAF